MRSPVRFFDMLIFASVTPLIRLGAKRGLQPEDFPELPSHLDPRTETIDERRIDWSSGRRLLLSHLRATLKYWLPPLGFYLLFAVMNLSGPVLVNLFLTRISQGLSDSHALWQAVIYGIGVGGVGIVGGLALQIYFYYNMARWQIVTNVVNKKLFSHSLRLTKEARERTHVGDIVNHMSVDTDAIAEVGNAVSDLIYCTLMIGGAIGLLFYYLGSTAWVAVVLLLVLLPITRKVAKEFTRFDKELMKWRDERVTLMAQILSAIRLVKYFVWEKSVASEVARVRLRELEARNRIARADLLVTLLYVSVGTFILFAALTVYVWRGNQFDAALLFTCVSLFALLEDPFAYISRVITQMINGKVGAERIAAYLALPTVPTMDRASATEGAAGVEIENLSVIVGESHFKALKGVSLHVPAGSSLAVVGSVGAGKSSFIHALLGEVQVVEGRIQFTDNRGLPIATPQLGYVPQEAYILNGTLRENLTFGREDVSEAEIQRALYVSGLAADLASMQGGLAVEIGEKGINLSGGQRQRLSLARAVLQNPRMVILDDPLSAVDPSMEHHIVEELIFGEWRNTTRVMITHRLTHLDRFDRIAFFDHGRLIALGTYDELKETSPEFRLYMTEHLATTGHVAPKNAEEKNTPAGEALRVTEEEDREYGAVKGSMYRDYILSLGGENHRLRPVLLFLLLIAVISSSALPLLQRYWLSFTADVQSGKTRTFAFLHRIAEDPMSSMYAYGVLGLVLLLGALSTDLFWLKRGLAAGRMIHDRMLKSVLGSNLRFFDSTPIGRVLQRFSRDMEAIDIHLRWCFEVSMKCFAQVAVTLILIVSALPVVIVFLVPVMALYYRFQKLYRASAREAKRLDSISRSPRYAHFKETLQGLVVIRAFGKTEWFFEEFYKRLSHNQRMFYGHYMINRWFSSRIPVIGGLVAIATTIGIVWSVKQGALNPGLAGLLTVYSLSFWGVLNWGIRIWSDVESQMTSMERVKFYMNLPQEPMTLKDGDVPEVWPTRGEVVFENVKARYADHMPLVLKGLSFKVEAGTRVGIIGRTGSGKSTIFQALYRFINLEEGRILIDGVDIAQVPLPRLRRALAIIPQDPTLFMGTLRSNLDRYGEYDDAKLWDVLDRTNLGDFVRALPKRLDTELTENGLNLSQGQRQLLCLARALLMRAKIIILDEATASVDVQTDAAVQRVLRESCKGLTMMIIAHRLGTIRDCDQIIEIRDGHRHLAPRTPELHGELVVQSH